MMASLSETFPCSTLATSGKMPESKAATVAKPSASYATKQPAFARAAGMTGLRCIIEGYGYDITSVDVLDACSALMHAADAANIDAATVKAGIHALVAANPQGGDFVQKILARQLLE
jgi:hypothetical protein